MTATMLSSVGTPFTLSNLYGQMAHICLHNVLSLHHYFAVTSVTGGGWKPVGVLVASRRLQMWQEPLFCLRYMNVKAELDWLAWFYFLGTVVPGMCTHSDSQELNNSNSWLHVVSWLGGLGKDQEPAWDADDESGEPKGTPRLPVAAQRARCSVTWSQLPLTLNQSRAWRDGAILAELRQFKLFCEELPSMITGS